jgi:hypothetical protein
VVDLGRAIHRQRGELFLRDIAKRVAYLLPERPLGLGRLWSSVVLVAAV